MAQGTLKLWRQEILYKYLSYSFQPQLWQSQNKVGTATPTLDTTWNHLKATFRVHQCKYLIIYNIVHYHISLAN